MGIDEGAGWGFALQVECRGVVGVVETRVVGKNIHARVASVARGLLGGALKLHVTS